MNFPKLNYSRIAIALLIGAVVGLGYITWHQAQIIQAQRHLILEFWQFVQAGCPFDKLQ